MRTVQIAKNVYFTKTPIYVVFFVTSACNARCKMCFNWKNTDNPQISKNLTLDEIKMIFGSFSSIQQLTISGGEPFMRQDLPEIISFVSRQNKLQSVTIPTNGIMTRQIVRMTRKTLNEIKHYTHLRVSLSVEGIGAKHDKIVAVKGAFNKLLATYNALVPLLKQHKNFSIDISICCSAYNKKDISELMKYCAKRFSQSTLILVLARGDTREKGARQITKQEYLRILDEYYLNEAAGRKNKPHSRVLNAIGKIANYQAASFLAEPGRKKMPGKCYSGNKLIVIQNDGTVFPCESLGTALGNLRDFDYDILRVLASGQSKKIQKYIQAKKCVCTWECALNNNLVCNPAKYPEILKELISRPKKAKRSNI